MSVLSGIILFSLLGGILSVLAASTVLLVPEKLRVRIVPHLISFAIGSLLGAAFLGLLPHAINSSVNTDMHSLFLVVLLGLLGFFTLEKLVLWRHCHSDHCEAHAPDAMHHDGHVDNHSSAQNKSNAATGTLILVGDAMHNLVDGILIAAAFLTDFHLGVVTAIAIAAHEIPQEVSDFLVLLHSGFSRSKALVYNIISSLATVLGALLAYFSLSQMQEILPYVLAVAASSFIYISVADLIPGLHKRTEFLQTVQQIALIASGVTLIYFTHSSLH